MNSKRTQRTKSSRRIARAATPRRPTHRGWLFAVLVLAECCTAFAQQTNAPSAAGSSLVTFIADRNIFNSNRYPHRTGSRPKESPTSPLGDSFSLVGTMSYAKGTFAFFDGTHSEYRKVLKLQDEIAGFKLAEITPTAVTLEVEGKQIELRVGAQMRHEDEGGWQLVAQAESLPEAANDGTSSASPDSASRDGSSGEVNDVLKKLMKQREQELK